MGDCAISWPEKCQDICRPSSGTDAIGRVTVKFLKRVEFGKFVWPDTDDNDCIDRACVTKVLPEPQMDRRSRIAFPIEID